MTRRLAASLVGVAVIFVASCRVVLQQEATQTAKLPGEPSAQPMAGYRPFPAHPLIPPSPTFPPEDPRILAAMLSIHAHAFWPNRHFPGDYNPISLEQAVAVLKDDHAPLAALRKRRAVARLAAYGLEGDQIRPDFRAAIDALGADPAALELKLKEVSRVPRDVFEGTIFDALERYFRTPECRPENFRQMEPKYKVGREGGSVILQAEIRVQRNYEEVARAIDPQKWDVCSPLFSPPERTYLIESTESGGVLLPDLDGKGNEIPAPAVPAGNPYGPELLFEHFTCATAGCPSSGAEFLNHLTVSLRHDPNPTRTISACPSSVVGQPRYHAGYFCNKSPCKAAGVRIDDGGLWSQADGGTSSLSWTRACLDKKLEFENELENDGLEAAWRVLGAEMTGLLAHIACCPIPREALHFGGLVNPSCVTHH